MSLRVWLSLDGDLKQHGASDIVATAASHATVASAGKIGKCYNLDGSTAAYIELSKAPLSNDTEEFSYACWFYPTNTTTSMCLYSNRTEINSNGFTIFVFNSGSILYDAGDRWSQSTSLIPATTWTHLVFTYKKGVGRKIYINGVEKYSINTAPAPKIANATKAFIGASQSTSTVVSANFMNGKLNDVRIYDHCLSAAEVKEIAQGLVLHYKLDLPTKNWLANSGPCINSLSSWSAAGSNWGHNELIENNFGPCGYVVHNSYTGTTATPGGTYHTVYGVADCVNGEVYTVSCWARASKTCKATFGFEYMTAYTTIDLTTEWQHFSYSKVIDTSKSNRACVLYVQDAYAEENMWIETCAWKLEEGDKATGWVPHTTDALYEMLNIGTIEDSSGYGHDGTIIGDLIANSITPRYSSSTKWNCSSPSDNSETGICYIQTQLSLDSPKQITFAWWSKPENGYGNSVNNAAFCTSNNATRPTDYNTTTFHHRDSGFDVYLKNTSHVLRPSFSFYTKNEWHHYAFTYDGKYVRGFKDGFLMMLLLLEGSDIDSALASFSYLYIGYSQAGGVKRKTLGSYSDFRIYATALSADDILELYHTSAKIDNLGGVHTFELVEGESEHITKEGLIETDGVYENGYQSILQYDKNIYTEPDGSTWAHVFHHNNPSNGRFSNSTADWSNGIYIDANRWYDVEKMLYNLVKYEFMVKQKTTSDATETKWRWVQNINPMDATWATVGTDACVYNTSSGYATSSYKKGMYIFKTSNLHMCIANNSNGNWYGGIGAVDAFNGGIPGYPNTTVTTGYIDLYVRVYLPAKIIQNTGFSALEFIEK